MAGEDMVHVRLSAAGIERAGNGSLRMYGSMFAFEFKPGDVQRVTRAYDWDRVLSRETNERGEPLFEVTAEIPTEGV